MFDRETLDRECDLNKLIDVLVEIGEPYQEPFVDRRGDIVVRMCDDFAFIFTANGVRKD